LSKATINLYGSITTMSRRVVNVFEDVVSVNVYQKTITLPPGRYRLSIAAKDVTSGNTTTYEAALDVPNFEEDKLASSSLILGDTTVPRVSAAFRSTEKLGIYVQLYHLENAVIEYQITRNGTNEVVLNYSEETTAAQHLTLKTWLPLTDLTPGPYTLQLNVTDRAGSIHPSAPFTIVP
jgi:hypothetical protein